MWNVGNVARELARNSECPSAVFPFKGRAGMWCSLLPAGSADKRRAAQVVPPGGQAAARAPGLSHRWWATKGPFGWVPARGARERGGSGGGWGAHASSPLGTHYTYFRTHHRKTGCVWSFKRGSFKGAVLCPSFCSGAAGLPVQPTSYSTSCTVLASSSTGRLRRVGASARRRCSAASVVPSASPCVPR